jgi:hypothetical protein
VNGIIRIDYLYASQIEDKKDKNRLYFDRVPNTINCVRVEIDILGRIRRKEGA